jgi:hypothetical protein
MREIMLYCSARDQEVRVVLTDEPTHDGQAPLADLELLCMEIGEKCTGNLCPVCAQPATIMDARLARSGLAEKSHPKVIAQCDGCGRVTELVLTLGGYATCTECHSTRLLSGVEDAG